MQQVTINIEKNEDLELLSLLAERLGLKVLLSNHKIAGEFERERHLEIIAKGGDRVPSIEDPMHWQKEERKNRTLPFES